MTRTTPTFAFDATAENVEGLVFNLALLTDLLVIRIVLHIGSEMHGS